MDLNELGSIASILAFIIAIISIIFKAYKIVRSYFNKKDKNDNLIKDSFILLADSSTTVTKRSDTYRFIQTQLDVWRHKIILAYFNLVLDIITFSFYTLLSLALNNPLLAILFLILGFILALLDMWAVYRLEAPLNKIQNELVSVWKKYTQLS